MNTYYVELNFCGNQVIDTGIAISQGDYGQVQFSIATKKDGQYISDAQSAEIVFKLSNGYIVNGTMTGAGGLYSYIFQGNELQSAGKTVATVIDGRVSSESFTFSVRYNPLYDRGIEAGPYITQLESIREQAQGYVDYLEILISQLREDVEATALTKADLQNDFLQTQPGFKALDAAVGSQIVQTSHIDNNLTGTDPTHVLASPQGKKLEEEITQLKSDLTSKFQSLADYKNQGVVGTVSNCWVNTIGHIAIADFGLFLVSQHLGESDVVVFTIPDGFRPRQESYGVMSSTDGEFSTKVSAEISGEIKLSRTPSTAKYLGGQVIFLIN